LAGRVIARMQLAETSQAKDGFAIHSPMICKLIL
jgi:hypothetical protein